MSLVLGLSQAKEPWFWGFADAVALVLILLNLFLLLAVHLRRLRQFTRGKRERDFRSRVEHALASTDPQSRDAEWLRERLGRFDSLERPIAATMLIERLRLADDEERQRALVTLREAGAVDRAVRSLGARLAWRRALAARTLGWVGADEAVPALIERTSDRNAHVRESAVRALGRIADARALPLLRELFEAPGRVGTGVVYDALTSFGATAAPSFAGSLGSAHEDVRISSCFGVAALGEPQAARALLEQSLGDPSPRVRSAAAASLGEVGGDVLPEALARAAQDEETSVRNATAGALGSFDDPRAVELALQALDDPDRDTAVHAGEALVRLARGHRAGSAADEALRRASEAWPVERALIYAALAAGVG
jgi:HEAT repeat protein